MLWPTSAVLWRIKAAHVEMSRCFSACRMTDNAEIEAEIDIEPLFELWLRLILFQFEGCGSGGGGAGGTDDADFNDCKDAPATDDSNSRETCFQR